VCLSSMLVDVIAIETLSRVIVAWAGFVRCLPPFIYGSTGNYTEMITFRGYTLEVHMGLQVDSSRSSSL
jgi:hypothetical protein